MFSYYLLHVSSTLSSFVHKIVLQLPCPAVLLKKGVVKSVLGPAAFATAGRALASCMVDNIECNNLPRNAQKMQKVRKGQGSPTAIRAHFYDEVAVIHQQKASA